MLRELNPCAAVVRRSGAGGGGRAAEGSTAGEDAEGRLLQALERGGGAEATAHVEKNGCWQAVVAARREEEGGEGAAGEGGEEEGEEESGEEGSSEEEGEGEGEEGEGEGEGSGEEEGSGEWVPPALSRFAFFARRRSFHPNPEPRWPEVAREDPRGMPRDCRPFHPARLHELLMCGRLDGVIRSRGCAWVADRQTESVTWSQVEIPPRLAEVPPRVADGTGHVEPSRRPVERDRAVECRGQSSCRALRPAEGRVRAVELTSSAPFLRSATRWTCCLASRAPPPALAPAASPPFLERASR